MSAPRCELGSSPKVKTTQLNRDRELGSSPKVKTTQLNRDHRYRVRLTKKDYHLK
jgi:hypothetical protein